MRNVLLIIAPLAASVGCTTIETRYITPDCEVPPRPALVSVDAGELWDAVGDDMYRVLEERDARLTDWALELEAGMVELCGRAE